MQLAVVRIRAKVRLPRAGAGWQACFPQQSHPHSSWQVPLQVRHEVSAAAVLLAVAQAEQEARVAGGHGACERVDEADCEVDAARWRDSILQPASLKFA
jgi:hypothetical protein